MKKLFLVFTVIIGLSAVSNLKAQDYNTGIGFRLGWYNGLTVKHFFNNKGAVEGILTTRYGGLNLTGLYEHHLPFFDVNNMNWYFGAGGHVGFYNDNNTFAGIAGVLGAEYSFDAAPLNVGLDWQPIFSIVNNSGFLHENVALSVRYIF